MIKSKENLRKRKTSGGQKRAARSRRKFEQNEYAAETTIGKEKIVVKRTLGGNIKMGLRKTEFVNVFDESTKKISKVKIISVENNPANRDYDRRGVITKGTLVQTEYGNVKVVSRPGQDGVVNAVLMK